MNVCAELSDLVLGVGGAGVCVSGRQDRFAGVPSPRSGLAWCMRLDPFDCLLSAFTVACPSPKVQRGSQRSIWCTVVGPLATGSALLPKRQPLCHAVAGLAAKLRRDSPERYPPRGFSGGVSSWPADSPTAEPFSGDLSPGCGFVRIFCSSSHT